MAHGWQLKKEKYVSLGGTDGTMNPLIVDGELMWAL